MGTTTTDTIDKAKEDKRQVEQRLAEIERKKKEELEQAQLERLNQQNYWFWSLMDIDKIKSAKTKEAKLKIVQKDVTKEQKKQESQQKKDVAATKAQVLYEDRRKRSEQALEEIKTYLPGAKALVDQFIAAHKKADELLVSDPSAWDAAFKALHDVSVSDATGDAEKAWSESEKSGRKEAPKVFERIDAARKSLELAQPLMTVEAQADFVAKLDLAQALLHTQPKPTTENQKAADQLCGQAETALDEAVKAANLAKAQAEKLKLEATALLISAGTVPDFPGFAPTDDANFQRQMKAAETNVGLHDFDAAVQLLLDLKTQIETRRDELITRSKSAREGWQKQLPGLKSLQQKADLVAKNTALPGSVTSVAQNVSDRLAFLQKAKVGADPTYEAAMAELIGLKSDLDALENSAGDVPGFKQACAAADQRVRKVADQVAQAIVGLADALVKGNAGKALNTALVVDPFHTRLSGLVLRWEKLLETAIEPKELMEDVVTADLQTLLADIQRVATQGVGDAVLEIVLAPGREEYQKVREKAMSVALSVTNINAEDGAELVEAVESADLAVDNATTAKQIEELTAQLKKLTETSANRADSSELGITAFQQMLADKLKPVPELISGFKNKVDEKNKTRDAAELKPFIALLDTLQTEYETLLALKTSKQRALLEQALDDADALIEEIETATLAIDKKRDKKDPRSFVAAKKRIDDYNKRLQDEDVKTYALSTATELGDAAKALEKKFGTTTLTELFRQLDSLGEKIDAVEQKALAAKGLFGPFEAAVKTYSKTLDGEPYKTDAPDYAAALKGRLSALLNEGRFEDGLSSAQAGFERLKAEVEQALASPKNLLGQSVDIVDQQNKAVEAKRKAELDKAKWEGELEVVEKALTAASGGEIDSKEIAGLKSTLADTKKGIEKSHQYGDGRDQLKAIRNRLALLEANPYGLVISARNQLPGCVKRVRGAIVKLSQALNVVSKAVTELEGDLGKPAKDAVVGQLAAVRGLFNPAAFDKSVPIVANADLDRNARSAAREDALRDVRRMMSYLDTDYRMQVLADTPYNKAMRSVLSTLKLELLDLENNLLVSMAK